MTNRKAAFCGIAALLGVALPTATSHRYLPAEHAVEAAVTRSIESALRPVRVTERQNVLPALIVARRGHAATLLADGTIAIAGGEASDGFTTSIEVLNPATLTTSQSGNSLLSARTELAAVLLPGNELLLSQGRADAGAHASSELRQEDGAVVPLPAGLFDRSGHTATLLLDGRVILLGGIALDGELVQRNEEFGSQPPPWTGTVYDPRTGRSAVYPQVLSTPRSDHSATLLPDGRILVIGGRGPDGPLATAEITDPLAGTNAPQPSALQFPRMGHTATLLPDGSVIVAGGESGGLPVSTIERFDPATGQFSLSTSTLVLPRRDHTATLAPTGKVIIVGGATLAGVTGSIEELSIDADSVFPSITATAPANQQLDVPRNTLIGVRFSEPIAASSVTATTFTVTKNGQAVSGKRGTAGNGLYVFFVPSLPLDPATAFEVVVDGLTDFGGHPISATSFAFTTAVGQSLPPLDRTVATSLSSAAEFLYLGSGARQTGVTATIDPRRVSILRGRVKDRAGAALSGVTLTIRDHADLGSTQTTADGGFDFVVNGGGLLTVEYKKMGYLPVLRQVEAPWADYTWLPDVAMTPLDPDVTVVTAGAPSVQVARGSSNSDADGVRRPTVVFRPGTTATAILANGVQQGLTTLSVRATEYTRGADGPAAMPAPLPASSGYTFAAELSIDEAIAIGAKEVRFSQTVPVYVENFLGFPVGEDVPLGYLDVERAAWLPADNGRIIKFLSLNGPFAELDIDGSGQPASSSELADFGLTDDERSVLAQLYQPGQSFWRLPLAHFTAWDANWPFGPPADAVPPTESRPETDASDETDDSPCAEGSIIDCENQALGERISIVGSRFGLSYRSNRQRGPASHCRVRGRLIGAVVPTGLKRIELEAVIAGQRVLQSFPANPDLAYDLTWDGRDPYGRDTQGTARAQVRIGYVYDGVYRRAAAGGRSFAVPSSVEISGSRTRQEITLTQVHNVALGGWDAKALGFGGWTLDVHHAYDAAAGALYLGTGNRSGASTVTGHTVRTAAGGGSGDPTQGGSATNVSFNQTSAVSVAPDGTVWLTASRFFPCCGTQEGIYKVATDGTIHHVGNDLGYVRAVAPDGSVYIANYLQYKIQRIRPDGVVVDVAGNGTDGFSGDGGQAVDAQLGRAFGVALAPDGTLYIGDTSNRRVRRVSPDGIITTVAGTGTYGYGGDGGPAVDALLKNPTNVIVAPDGALLISDLDNYRVRRLAPDGTITTLAGNGGTVSSGDGGAAVDAALRPMNIAIDSAGNVFIADYGRTVRVVSSDGLIRTLAGNGDFTFNGDGGPATATAIGAREVAAAADGSIYVASSAGRILRVASALPVRALTDVLIASAEGSEAFVFDQFGRHLRTLDARTGSVRLSFAYGSDGLLADIRDAHSNAFQIERNGGAVTGFISPGGQRTAAALDVNGYLSGVRNPAGHVILTTHSSEGLLTSLTDANGHRHEFTYGADGRLEKDADAAGGHSALTRAGLAGGHLVTLTSALGRSRSYELRRLPDGNWRRVYTGWDGGQTTTDRGSNGSDSITAPDGSVAAVTVGGDPRWGLQAPFVKAVTTTMPSGLRFSMVTTRTATLTDSSNPLSLATQTDTVAVNAKTYTTVFDAALRQFTTTTPLKRQFMSGVDSFGRLTESRRSGLDPVFLAYDARGRLATVTQSTRQYSIEYDPQNRPIRLVDPVSRAVLLEYDAADRLLGQIRPDGTEVRFSHDASGNLTSLVPPERPAHAFSHTPADLVATYEPPALGVSPVNTVYTYNVDKQLATEMRPGGSSVAAGYDSSGRLETLMYSRGQIAWVFNAVTKLPASVTGPDASLSFTFDGTLPIGTSWSGSFNGNVTRSYNADLRVISEKVNGGAEATFAYDNDGLLTRAGGLSLSRHAQHGLITTAAMGAIQNAWTYSTLGEVSRHLVTGSGGAELFDVQFTRDALGRIAQKIETIDTIQRVFGYQYDAAGRLSAVSLNGPLPTVMYTYDSNGNRTAATTAAGIVFGTYDAQDRLTQYGAATYTYGAHGELSSRTDPTGTTQYAYDEFGNLITVILPSGTRIDYLVDPLHRRIGKKVNGAFVKGWLYGDQLRPVAELDGAGGVIARFVYGTDANVPDYMVKAGQTYRFVKDQRGSPRILVNVIGSAVVQRLDYDPSGMVTQDSNPGFHPFGFAGGLYDADTQLVRFGARDYDGATGRWTAKDPIRFGGRDPNLYVYAAGDPINMVDIDGRQVLARALPAAGAAALADGPLPIGDMLGLGIITVAVAIDIIRAIRNSDETQDESEVCPVALPDGQLGPDNLPKGEGWEWRGPRDKGAAHNPGTRESLRPDKPHGPYGPHYDYKDPAGKWWRVNPETGRMNPKR